MSRSTPLIAGLLGSFAISATVLVAVPNKQIGHLQPQTTEEDGKITDVYPVQTQHHGAKVYIAEGCAVCHTQQVRDEQNGSDTIFGWGPRRTVARDYIYDSPPQLGALRLGPDLANTGAPGWRNNPDKDTAAPAKRDAAWHYAHLYNPALFIKDSNMPPYRYLFEKRKITGAPGHDALSAAKLGHKIEAGHEIVPTTAARHLVAYLLSLDRTHAVNEVKTPAAPAAAK